MEHVGRLFHISGVAARVRMTNIAGQNEGG